MAIGFNKFMNKAKHGLQGFGSSAAHAVSKGARFLGTKVLPTVEKVAGGIATAASYAAPVLAFTPLAELAPVVGGIGLAARGIQKGAKMGRKVIRDTENVISAAKTVGKGVQYLEKKVAPQIEKAASVAANRAPMITDAAMRISRPPGFRKMN